MVKNILKKHSQRISLLILLIVAAVAIYGLWPYIKFLNNRDELEMLINSTGAWAPLVYIVFQIIQVVIAPIPGSIISLVGGYIFGAFLGTLYNLIGSFLGFYMLFYIAKKFGRPLVKYFVKEEILKKYEKSMQDKGKVFLFIAFLIPMIPDATVGYIAGLSKLSIPTLMIMVMVARLPGLVILNLIGSQTANSNYAFALILVTFLFIGLVIAYYYREKLEQVLSKFLGKKS